MFRKKVANFIKKRCQFHSREECCKFHPHFTNNVSVRFDPGVPSSHFAYFLLL